MIDKSHRPTAADPLGGAAISELAAKKVRHGGDIGDVACI